MDTKTILSLFDASGVWSGPYRKAGYNVIQIDLELGLDVLELDIDALPKIHGILAAPPCTDFSLSGSRFFKKKDADGTTAASLKLVDKTLEIIDKTHPSWWVVENPMSRIHTLRPQLGKVVYQFDPCDHGDPWKKRTWLWGTFTVPQRHPVEATEGRMTDKVGGKSAATKKFRSQTPAGFARDFFEANP